VQEEGGGVLITWWTNSQQVPLLRKQHPTYLITHLFHVLGRCIVRGLIANWPTRTEALECMNAINIVIILILLRTRRRTVFSVITYHVTLKEGDEGE